VSLEVSELEDSFIGLLPLFICRYFQGGGGFYVNYGTDSEQRNLQKEQWRQQKVLDEVGLHAYWTFCISRNKFILISFPTINCWAILWMWRYVKNTRMGLQGSV
jgi:hypothetical protein